MNPSITSDTAVHVHALWPDARHLGRINCPTCGRRTFAVGWHAEWYGWSTTCLRCGERWEDGEMCERPFVRGWRKKSIASAKKRWRRENP